MVRRAFMFLMGILFMAVGILVAPSLASAVFQSDPVSIFFPIFPFFLGLILFIASFRKGDDIS